MEFNNQGEPEIATPEKVVEKKIPIGSIVANLAHPFHETNSNILITTYAHFTPPLMVVIEKNYGVKYNSLSGEHEDNDSYKCLYYSTINGSFESNWFKRRELKLIDGNLAPSSKEHKNTTLEDLKKQFLGRMMILKSVDLELGKKKIWSDDDETQKMKTNNLLDYLPPLGSVIDVKYNDDPQKYSEKDGKPIHRKSKILVKLRWLNNITSKYSEEYISFDALKVVDISLLNFSSDKYYFHAVKIYLEEITDKKIVKVPLKIKDILWKHYFYIYRFVDQFSGQIKAFSSEKELQKITDVSSEETKAIQKSLDHKEFKYKGIMDFFKTVRKADFEKKWFEIQYSDKNEKYTKRIIYINELIVEKTTIEPMKETRLLKANCLLRNGSIRHFNVARIRSYRELPKEFIGTFVAK
jgi:hypothetical protein